jgi:hypothetical protein
MTGTTIPHETMVRESACDNETGLDHGAADRRNQPPSEGVSDHVPRMRAHLVGGLSAAEAALAAIDGPLAGTGTVRPRDGLAETTAALALAVGEFDEPAAHAALDRLPSTLAIEVLPRLRGLSEHWGERSGERGVGTLREQPGPRPSGCRLPRNDRTPAGSTARRSGAGSPGELWRRGDLNP